MIVANPIYDIVFKYLMEDERIARTILSALLKKNIVKVEVRPHEYANDKRDPLSIFRIDFAATVRDDYGKDHLILIELQKTWLETETLRFRQYLGVQYQNPKNMVGEKMDRHALPLVAVYILGHKVGDIEEPVLYVSHNSYDYNGNPVTKGLPNPFVDSLTHDSIIVQIPRLHGQINNRLDKVLSIFDQTRMNNDNQHELRIEDDLYAGDEDMQHILHRLLMAAADSAMRQDMNVEDEYFSVIESRDTEIMMKTRELAEKTVELKQKSQQLEQKNQQLEQKDQQLDQKDQQLEQMDQQLEQKDQQLEQKDQQLEQMDQQLEQKDQQLEQKDQQLKNMLRQSVMALLVAGKSPVDVAEALNIDLGTVMEIAKDL